MTVTRHTTGYPTLSATCHDCWQAWNPVSGENPAWWQQLDDHAEATGHRIAVTRCINVQVRRRP